MKRIALLLAILVIPSVTFAQQRYSSPQGWSYTENCNCSRCQQERSKRAVPISPPASQTAVPAPTTPPTVKASPVEPTQTAQTTDDILKQAIATIENDATLPDSLKKKLITQITGTHIESPVASQPVSPQLVPAQSTPIDLLIPLTPIVIGPAIPFSLVRGAPAVKSAQEETVQPAETGEVVANPDAFELSAPHPVDDKFQIPKITINGAEQAIPIGELVQLSVSLDSKPKDFHSVSYTWTVLPKKSVIVWPDGTRIIFGTGTQTQNFTVILTASFVYTVKEGEKITEVAQRSTTSTATVQIQGGSTPPGPGPGPVDPINPDGGLTGLSKQAFDWVGLVSRTGTYTDDKVKADAKKLATSFNNIAAAIAAGTYPDVQAILKASKESNDAAIENRNEWLPWFTKMSEHLQQAYSNGTTRTPQQFASAWREITKGLEAAAK